MSRLCTAGGQGSVQAQTRPRKPSVSSIQKNSPDRSAAEAKTETRERDTPRWVVLIFVVDEHGLCSLRPSVLPDPRPYRLAVCLPILKRIAQARRGPGQYRASGSGPQLNR